MLCTLESERRLSGIASSVSRLFCSLKIFILGAFDRLADKVEMKFSFKFKSQTCKVGHKKKGR